MGRGELAARQNQLGKFMRGLQVCSHARLQHCHAQQHSHAPCRCDLS